MWPIPPWLDDTGRGPQDVPGLATGRAHSSPPQHRRLKDQQAFMLLLESDAEERARLTEALQEAGIPVQGVSSIAEVERWPEGDLVITDVQRFTNWWKEMGATHVVVIASTPEEGAAACQQGATMWVLRPCDPEQLVAAVKSILDTD